LKAWKAISTNQAWNRNQ